MDSTIKRGAAAHSAEAIAEAFPEIEHLMEPLGNAVLVQMRRVKKVSAGGILMPGESRDWDAAKTRVGKVIAMGPLAYKKRDSSDPWPEGAWVKIGDYVRVPLHAGVDGWRVAAGQSTDAIGKEIIDYIQFNCFNDYDIKQRLKDGCNPLDIVDYI